MTDPIANGPQVQTNGLQQAAAQKTAAQEAATQETTTQGAQPVPAPSSGDQENHDHGHGKAGFWGLSIGSVGVVYGDIGTSPLYALKESLHHTAKDGLASRIEVIGVVSLLIWALMIVVTLKYVVFILRADNKGEGGTLSLMALAQTKLGRNMGPVFFLGVIGAALFYGDSIITPAISVLSAVEGLKQIDALKDTALVSNQYIVLFAAVILIGLFAVQSRGTGKVATWFGPIMVVWFLTLGIFGLMHIGDDLGILAALSPYYAAYFLANHGMIGLIVLGSVFLAVTGAEALYADMGHFGRTPIRMAWIFFVFPSLVLNYLGQGALILQNPTAMANRDYSPFFSLAPEALLIPFIVLSLAATVIASQAVITGAFSLTQQAVQLGLLPRLEIRHTSEKLRGQIYLPQINWLLMIGVLILVLTFRTSSSLANAYGIAVTGAMLADAGLFYFVTRHVWGWKPWKSFMVVTPFIIVDFVFFGANLLKLLDGAYMPLLFGALLIVVMWTWVRGSRIVFKKERRDSLPVADLFRMLEKSQPVRVKGTADAQPQAQQGAAPAQHHPHHQDAGCALDTRARADQCQPDLWQRGHTHHRAHWLHADAARAAPVDPRAAHGPRFRHHADVILSGTAHDQGVSDLGDACMAGQPLHLPRPHGHQCHGLLPHSHRARGGNGQSGHCLTMANTGTHN
jgi:KUP system potassium uptake protein